MSITQRIQSSELENRAPDQDGRKSVRSFANVKRVCVDSGLWRVAIFVQRPSLTHSFRTDAKSGAWLVRDFCGLGFHRGPYGYCMRNGTVAVPPLVVAPSPVVVAPSPVVVVPAAPVVVAPIVCPYGYYLGPYGRCLLY